MFCLPYAGGGAAIYRTWAEGLPASVEVCAVEIPGRGRRVAEPAFQRMEPLVEAAAEALAPALDVPYALFGHSMGALVAFEFVRRQRRAGAPLPAHLFVSAHRAPQLPDSDPPIHALPDDEFVEELRRLNGTPPEVFQHAELMDLLLPMLRADFAMVETYRYAEDAPLAVPISGFGGLYDEDLPQADLAAWREQTTNQFVLRMVPGDHFFLRSAQSLLLRLIARDLATTLGGL